MQDAGGKIRRAEEAIEFCGIRCTSERLYEIDSGRIMVEVSKRDVQWIKLRYGLQAPHPLFQFIVGVVVASPGLWGAMAFVKLASGGEKLLKYAALMVPMAVVGAFVAISALKRGYFLDIELSQGHKRIAFHRRPHAEGMTTFLAAVEAKLERRIEREADPG
jgi:hypothetical protein